MDIPTHISELVPNPDNERQHSPRGIGLIVDALHKVGAARSIVIDEDNVIRAGNGTVEAAAEAGITKVVVIDADGSTLVAVRRTGLTPEQKRDLSLYDNRSAEFSSWRGDTLSKLATDGHDLSGLFTAKELSKALTMTATAATLTKGDATPATTHVCPSCGHTWK